jgi:hypothetical protein
MPFVWTIRTDVKGRATAHHTTPHHTGSGGEEGRGEERGAVISPEGERERERGAKTEIQMKERNRQTGEAKNGAAADTAHADECERERGRTI